MNFFYKELPKNENEIIISKEEHDEYIKLKQLNLQKKRNKELLNSEKNTYYMVIKESYLNRFEHILNNEGIDFSIIYKIQNRRGEDIIGVKIQTATVLSHFQYFMYINNIECSPDPTREITF